MRLAQSATTGPDFMARGWSHTFKFPEIGTKRRAAVFAFEAATVMNPRSRLTSLQSKRAVSAARSPANAPMAT